MMHSLSLNGVWSLRWFDGQRKANFVASVRDEEPSTPAIPAEVPGEVHLDLMREGIIGDTNLGANVLASRWVEEFQWAYRRTFDAPRECLAARSWLVFDRLFLNARVFLNGEEVGSHANAFRPCRIEVTGRLRETGNVLAVFVESGLYDAADKPAAGYAFHEDAKLHKRHFQRAPQCSFGWDWAPRLLNVGISGDVRLEWTTAPVVWENLVPLVSVEPSLDRASVLVRFIVASNGASEVEARAELPELGLALAKTFPLKDGENRLELELAVDNPALWWPRGHGEAKTFALNATLSGPWGQEEKTKRIGFRRAEWDQSPHPDGGTWFRLLVNNTPVFCKGANLVPSDTLFVRIDESSYRGLVDRALEANFNFLRVWGGGLYEPDCFYDICDQEGILVWQEFIYACSRYPTLQEEFNTEVKREALHHIRRLAGRPSLVAWCGNNENETGNWHWGFDKGLVHPDYAFFHLTLPRMLKEEDPTVYYQPSSPISPERAVDPDSELTGDQHPWSIGFTDTDTRGYRRMRCRFPNEGGTLGPTTLAAMREALSGGPEVVGSHNWNVHDNSIATWHEPSPIEAQVEAFLGIPIGGMTVEEFVYWGGIVQSEGLTEYINAFRTKMFDSSSAIFWMFNDTWPAVRSWTIIDHRLRRCPSFGPVKRAMQPVSAAIVAGESSVDIIGLNDTLEPVKASVRFGLFELAGGFALDEAQEAVLAPNSATVLARFARSQWTDPAAQGAFAILAAPDGRQLAQSRLFLPKWTEMKWPAPEIALRAERGGIAACSRTFVPGAAYDLEGTADASANFIDLIPGVEQWFPAESLIVGDLSSGTPKLHRLSP